MWRQPVGVTRQGGQKNSKGISAANGGGPGAEPLVGVRGLRLLIYEPLF